MSDQIILLEDLFSRGKARADRHFEALMECVSAVIPEPLRKDLPKCRADVKGIFTGSTNVFVMSLFTETDEYSEVNARFLFSKELQQWALDNFCVLIGSMVFQSEIGCDTLEDAALMAHRIAELKRQNKMDDASVHEVTQGRSVTLQ